MSTRNKNANKNSSVVTPVKSDRILDVVKKAAEDTAKIINNPIVKDAIRVTQENARRIKEWKERKEYTDKLTSSIAKYQFEKEVEEIELRRLMLEKLREETSTSPSNLPPPSYNTNSCVLSFMGKAIPIPSNTNQDVVCKVIFKNKIAMRRVWSWDEILEESGERDIENTMWRKVYEAAREINNKVAIETGIKDLLIITKSTVTVNPQYLKK